MPRPKRKYMSAIFDFNFIFSGYNDMKTELKDFLQRFAAEGKVSEST